MAPVPKPELISLEAEKEERLCQNKTFITVHNVRGVQDYVSYKIFNIQ